MAPRIIGPYRVLEALGSGGVGTVYRAIDRRTGDMAALKLLSTGAALNPKAARRLAREFETLQRLSHPNVVKVYDAGVFMGFPYLAMELVEGLTLRHYLSLADDVLASEHGLAEAIDEQRRAYNAPADADELSADLSVDAEPPGNKPALFTWGAFSEEAPSDDVPSREYEEGAAAMNRLADLADEPDTHGTQLSAEQESLPYEVPRATADHPPLPTRPSARQVELLNRPERVGRLKDALLQLCAALAYVHGMGLIHRDLKPANVMVDDDRTVRLMDFGLARYLADDAHVTADGRLVGTFRYMAPEQILGERLDARSDLYALGVILYELLAGRAPFEARTPYELWQQVLETESAPLESINPGVDRMLARLAHRLIRKEPDERPQTAEEVYEALIE